MLLRAKRLGSISALKTKIDLHRSKSRFFVSWGRMDLQAKTIPFAEEELPHDFSCKLPRNH